MKLQGKALVAAMCVGQISNLLPHAAVPAVMAQHLMPQWHLSATEPADSSALTSGMTASAAPRQRGATMAVHSTVGFGLSAVGAWAMGAAIDLAGGPGALPINRYAVPGSPGPIGSEEVQRQPHTGTSTMA